MSKSLAAYFITLQKFYSTALIKPVDSWLYLFRTYMVIGHYRVIIRTSSATWKIGCSAFPATGS